MRNNSLTGKMCQFGDPGAISVIPGLEVTLALDGLELLQIQANQAIDAVTECRIRTEAVESHTSGFAQVDIMPIKRGHTTTEPGQLALEFGQTGARILARPGDFRCGSDPCIDRVRV